MKLSRPSCTDRAKVRHSGDGAHLLTEVLFFLIIDCSCDNNDIKAYHFVTKDDCCCGAFDLKA